MASAVSSADASAAPGSPHAGDYGEGAMAESSQPGSCQPMDPHDTDLAAAAALYGPAVLGALAAAAAGLAPQLLPGMQQPMAWPSQHGHALGLQPLNVAGAVVPQWGVPPAMYPAATAVQPPAAAGMPTSSSCAIQAQSQQLPASHTGEAPSLSSHLASAPYTLAAPSSQQAVHQAVPQAAAQQPDAAMSQQGPQWGQSRPQQQRDPQQPQSGSSGRPFGWSVEPGQGFHQTIPVHAQGMVQQQGDLGQGQGQSVAGEARRSGSPGRQGSHPATLPGAQLHACSQSDLPGPAISLACQAYM